MSEQTDETEAADLPPTNLKRGISPFLLLLFVVGDMIGGGIYALVGQVAGITGGALWSAFLLALALALFTAFSYAELVTKYPRAGGAAFYVHRAFGSRLFSFFVAFAVVMSGVTSASALAIAFGGDYIAAFFNPPTVLVAMLFLLAAAAINYRGITESVTINAVFTLIEFSGLLLIVLIGLAALASGTGEPARALQFKEGVNVFYAVFAGAGLAFHALIGFEDSVNVAEETIDPSRSFPLALFGGILIAGLIYLVVTVMASMVVPTAQLVRSSGPLLEVVKEGPLRVPLKLFALIALFALANSALINMIMASRLLYGMSQEGVMPSIFSTVHPRRKTPVVAIAFTTVIALALVATGDVAQLARTTVLLLLAVFIVVNISVLVLRRDQVSHKHFRSPILFPILGMVVSTGLLTQQAAQVWMRAAALIVLGAVLFGVNLLVTRRLQSHNLDSQRPPSEKVDL